jgi:DNA-binding GntR family transcriptional regulator
MAESDMASASLHDRATQVSVKQAAYEGFQQALLSGRLRPGQLVSQREMTGMLGVSVGALRELLPRLEGEGLLTVMPQRGIQITAVNLSMIRDAFQLRAAYEREAVIGAVRWMPDEPLAEQRGLHLEIMDRLSTDTSASVLSEGQSIDSGFHKLLIEHTGNELLIQAYNVNTIRIRLINLDRILLNSDILPSAFADHLAIIDAILARDLGHSIDAMDTHIRNARQRAVAF